MAAETSGLLEPWKRDLFQETYGDSLVAARKVLTLYYLNLCTVGVVGATKLSWFTEFLSSKLHEAPESSMAIIIQTNRAGDDLAMKKEECDSEEEDGETAGSKAGKAYCYGGGTLRAGSNNAVRLSKQRVVDSFMSESKRLLITDAVVTFDASSVYGARSETHECLLLTATTDRPNLWHRSRLWRRHVVSGVPMLPVRQFVRPYVVLDNHLPPQGGLTIVQQYKQAM